MSRSAHESGQPLREFLGILTVQGKALGEGERQRNFSGGFAGRPELGVEKLRDRPHFRNRSGESQFQLTPFRGLAGRGDLHRLPGLGNRRGHAEKREADFRIEDPDRELAELVHLLVRSGLLPELKQRLPQNAFGLEYGCRTRWWWR